MYQGLIPVDKNSIVQMEWNGQLFFSKSSAKWKQLPIYKHCANFIYVYECSLAHNLLEMNGCDSVNVFLNKTF